MAKLIFDVCILNVSIFACIGLVNCIGQTDLRDITTGDVIYKHGYCDQPYVVITPKGDGLCEFTTAISRPQRLSQTTALT